MTTSPTAERLAEIMSYLNFLDIGDRGSAMRVAEDIRAEAFRLGFTSGTGFKQKGSPRSLPIASIPYLTASGRAILQPKVKP